jgi:hypothetical protein
LAERFAQSSRLAGWSGGAVRPLRARPGEQAQDAGDLDGVRGALPGVALEQLRRRVDEERQEHAVELGEIEGALEGAPGGGRVAERVAGDRLQQECSHHPGRMDPDSGDRAVDDGRERGGRRLRVVLGEPQRRQGGAHFCALALVLVQPYEGGFDPAGFSQPCES